MGAYAADGQEPERKVSSVISDGQLIRQANTPDVPMPALTLSSVPLMRCKPRAYRG